MLANPILCALIFSHLVCQIIYLSMHKLCNFQGVAAVYLLVLQFIILLYDNCKSVCVGGGESIQQQCALLYCNSLFYSNFHSRRRGGFVT